MTQSIMSPAPLGTTFSPISRMPLKLILELWCVCVFMEMDMDSYGQGRGQESLLAQLVTMKRISQGCQY